MNITYNRKVMGVIQTPLDFEKFIIQNKLYKFFKKFPENKLKEIQEKIDTTDSLPFKMVKPTLKKVLDYPETIYNPKFLECMGWDDIDINDFISKKQKSNSNILREKKSKNPELYYSSTTSRIEYWISKGYDEEKAKEELKKRQSTFSLDKCIEKYGEDVGLEIFNERQKKWVNSLKNNINIDDINKRKNSYKTNDYNFMVKRTSFLEGTKKIILKYLIEETIESFVDKILEEIDVKRYSDVLPYINSRLIHSKFNTDRDTIKNLMVEKTIFKWDYQTYGTPIYSNGNRFKSVKEYRLSLFLIENGVDFMYEGRYPNSNYKYDFYIPSKNTYIEYFGMLDGKNFNKLNSTQEQYLNKMGQKILFCKKNKLKLIQSTNFDELIKQLKTII
jgi:hypothetical protein